MAQHSERPTRIWLLHEIGEEGSDVWCDEPDPDGNAPDATEYVRADALKALEAENAKLREALTPSADTKAAYRGEVVLETISDADEDGLPVAVTRYVPWTAIKDTMKLIRARASESGKDDRQAP